MPCCPCCCHHNFAGSYLFCLFWLPESCCGGRQHSGHPQTGQPTLPPRTSRRTTHLGSALNSRICGSAPECPQQVATTRRYLPGMTAVNSRDPDQVKEATSRERSPVDRLFWKQGSHHHLGIDPLPPNRNSNRESQFAMLNLAPSHQSNHHYFLSSAWDYHRASRCLSKSSLPLPVSAEPSCSTPCCFA
jgi:hypothetical protein